MSKYARQILQAMKPVFTDLASEIQRSLGFYTSSHSNVKLTRVIAMGGGTKMRGLLQYLQQSLQMPIERPDAFKRVAINPSVSAAKFHESVCDFGVVYGLGVQALGLGQIESNLLPKNIAKSMIWASKTKYFVLAACLILVASVLAFTRTLVERASYTSKMSQREKIKAVLNAAEKAESNLKTEKDKSSESEAIINKEFEQFNYRDMVPLLYQKLIAALPNAKNSPEQAELYRAFAGSDAETIKEKYPDRRERKQIFVTGMIIYYTLDVANGQFGVMGFQKGLDERESDTTGVGGRNAPPDRSGRGGPRGGGRVAMETRGGRAIGLTPSNPSTPRGFVITMTGYSPYKDISELLDPVGVKNDQNQWGLVTRLMHLDKMSDGKILELYKKTDKQHFDLQTGEVDLAAEMPPGIGIRKKIEGKDDVLIDPMTNEIISKITNADKTAQVNDSWFVLSFKLQWKDANEPSSEAVTPPGTGRGANQPTPAPPPSSGRRSQSPKGGGGRSSGHGGGEME